MTWPAAEISAFQSSHFSSYFGTKQSIHCSHSSDGVQGFLWTIGIKKKFSLECKTNDTTIWLSQYSQWWYCFFLHCSMLSCTGLRDFEPDSPIWRLGAKSKFFDVLLIFLLDSPTVWGLLRMYLTYPNLLGSLSRPLNVCNIYDPVQPDIL